MLSLFCVVLIQEQLKKLDCVLPLKVVMKTSSPESAVALLSAVCILMKRMHDYLHSRLIMMELVTVSDVSQL